jgi:hypothetical protein
MNVFRKAMNAAKDIERIASEMRDTLTALQLELTLLQDRVNNLETRMGALTDGTGRASPVGRNRRAARE